VSAPAIGALRIGGASLAAPLVDSVRFGKSAATIARPFDGAIGNALFEHHVLVLAIPAGRLGMKVVP
jgi:hypothetical protein